MVHAPGKNVKRPGEKIFPVPPPAGAWGKPPFHLGRQVASRFRPCLRDIKNVPRETLASEAVEKQVFLRQAKKVRLRKFFDNPAWH